MSAAPQLQFVSGEPLPEGHFFHGLKALHYKFILLDPATKFSGGTKGRPQHYKRMTHEEVASMPLRDLAHPDGAWVGCWMTSPLNRWMHRFNEGWVERGGRKIGGWRARFSGRGFVWIKTHRKNARLSAEPLFLHRDGFHVGQGFTTRKNAEDLWLFKFGKPKRISRKIREPIFAPVREHSRKPDEAMDRVVAFADGPRCDLFSRSTDERFDVWGDQAGLFDAVTRVAA